jgi:membrane fusion protein (multidrug efflux system)
LERVAKARYEAALRSVDSQRALIKSRRVDLAIAQQSMDDSTIRAPFDGVIYRRHLAAGTYVQASSPLFTLVRVNPLRFRGRIPERKATAVQIGKKITIQIEGSEDELETVVKRVSPALDLASRSLQIEAEISNADGRFRSGLFVEGIIVVDEHATTIAVPRPAVGEFAGVYKVWLVEDGQLVSRRVSLGREADDLIELASGVKLGDVILADFHEGDAARRQAGKSGAQDLTKADH